MLPAMTGWTLARAAALTLALQAGLAAAAEGARKREREREKAPPPPPPPDKRDRLVNAPGTPFHDVDARKPGRTSSQL